MILDYELQIDKKDFLLSKITGRQYTDIGNFSKHIAQFGYTIDSYIYKYFYYYIPLCLETGEKVLNRKKGHWNKCILLSQDYKHLIPEVKILTGTSEIMRKMLIFYMILQYYLIS